MKYKLYRFGYYLIAFFTLKYQILGLPLRANTLIINEKKVNEKKVYVENVNTKKQSSKLVKLLQESKIDSNYQSKPVIKIVQKNIKKQRPQKAKALPNHKMIVPSLEQIFNTLNQKIISYLYETEAKTNLIANKKIITNTNINIPASREEHPSNHTLVQMLKDVKQMSVFPVGINVGMRNIKSSVLIRGQEDGERAVNFRNWLIPYDAVVDTLKLNITTLPDGQLEARSPGVVTRIDPKKLTTDKELGLVFSIRQIKRLFGVDVKFDINEYAIVLDIPWQNGSRLGVQEQEDPILLDGLPSFQPRNFSLTAVEQRIGASSSGNSSTSFRGDFLAVGSAFGGSWFLRTDQRDLENRNSWRISEAQFLRQTNKIDYFLGSQSTFWHNQSGNNYWGFTYIQRQGFTPPKPFAGGFSSSRQRLQADKIGRTITGEAEPGTLVQLVRGVSNVIAEILVDSSGIYRFENIKTKGNSFNKYRVFLYPQGQLTAQPEIRDANYSTVPGQIPGGASAWVFSGGWNREFSGNSLLGFGNFTNFRGGIARRWGVSENLTVGLGGVYDESTKALAEIFFRPDNFPLKVAVSALMGNEADIVSDIRFNPSRNLYATFTSDRFSERFNVNWLVGKGLSLFTNTSSRSATNGGIQLNFSGKNFYTFARASLDTENNFRWTWLQRLGNLKLTQRGNEIGTLSELTYNLSNSNSFLSTGNSLLLNYETRSRNGNDNLLTLGWQYRSRDRASDGNYLWEGRLGYGIGSQGNGLIASLGTTVFPGIMLRAQYQGISLTSDTSSFKVDLISSLNLQGGFRPGDRRARDLRTQGGLLVQPFLDENNNGKRDSEEKIYTETSESLLLVNNNYIKTLRPEITDDRVSLRLAPGSYKLELDPAGYPLDWQAQSNAFAVDVIAGSYTPVDLPLVRSYSRSGIVTDEAGKAVAGARVEAIATDDPSKRKFSVTNGAGVYYLERLQQGEYKLLINDQLIDTLKIEKSSEPFQELNLEM